MTDRLDRGEEGRLRRAGASERVGGRVAGMIPPVVPILGGRARPICRHERSGCRIAAGPMALCETRQAAPS